MKIKQFNSANALAVFPLTLLSVTISSIVHAQSVPSASNQLEEMVVLGRLRSSATDVVVERQMQAVAVDIITAQTISRTADSNVAEALRRLPGVTLVNDKYVYVRGLGERYLSTTLNGAVVPSPDLTRNVIPLDIFPTSIVENLAVQKVASADMPAAFGGGHVDIRTTGVPDGFLFNFELKTGLNSEADGDFITYAGGGDDDWGNDDGTRELSLDIRHALDDFRGNFSPQNILDMSSDVTTLEQAEGVNRNLATELYRDINVETNSGQPDIGVETNIGHVWGFSNGMEIGFLAGGSYDTKWRKEIRQTRSFSNPEELRGTIEKSTYSVNLTGNFSLGWVLNSENRIDTTNIFIRNTDDDVLYNNYHNSNFQYSGGTGQRYTEYLFEQREAMINQVHGKHELGYETMEALNLEALSFMEGLALNWYYSDSEATTDIPSALRVISLTTTDPGNSGEVLSSRVGASDRNSAQYRFSDLRDNVKSYGWDLKYPIQSGDFTLDLIGGTEYWDKSRYFEQLRFNLGSSSAFREEFEGPLGDLYSDTNIADPDFDFLINVQDASSSYLAANKVNAAFGKLDFTWSETWRFVAGVRWEDYQQVNLGWNPNEYVGSPIVGLTSAYAALSEWEEGEPNPVAEFFKESTLTESDYYGSLAITYITQDFWSEDFQLRLSFAESTVRPDIREIANSSYLDPITDISVNGNPDVMPSTLDNIDLRAEWFFSDGDNFTATLFYKDIKNPIELFEAAATDDNLAAKVNNGESAELSGLEIEYLVGLESIWEALSPFYSQGNITLLEHELIVGEFADSPTNDVRGLQGASDYSLNFILGFDSDDSKHAATLAYNVFGERLYYAGRLGAPDTFEQPFNSLNLTYSFYPMDSLSVKFEAKNLLDESLIIQRTNIDSDGNETDVDILESKPGTSLALKLKYEF